MTKNRKIIIKVGIAALILAIFVTLNTAFDIWIVPIQSLAKLNCHEYSRNITFCPKSIVRDYGAINTDGSETCYNKAGFRTGSIGGWGSNDDGYCIRDGCENGTKIMCR